MRLVSLLAFALFAVACAPPAADDSVDTAPPVDPVEDPTPYDGPAYRACVSDAQCDAGGACTTVPGYAGRYCSPRCDPFGDGAECALFELPFATSCLDTGRCVRGCGAADIPGATPQSGDEDTERCPTTVGCQAVEGSRLCAGEPYGQAGLYGTCTHPLVAGPDCPEATTCVGGPVIGLEELGVCLPWCDDGSCPTPPATAFNTTTICYDVFLDHPMCGLLCDHTSVLTTCPAGQECQEFSGYGLCAPPGAESPF